MKKPLLSICISVHNTAQYLERCLDSITSQSYKDYEIVMVNNGSTDNSLAVMEQYKKKHTDVQISIYSQEDRGLAQGRQTGINHACGEYITFIDADDYYLGNALEILMTTIQSEKVDIVEMQTLKDGKIVTSPFKGLFPAKDILRYFFEHLSVPPMLWLRVYKTKFFDKNIMPKTYTNNEDSFVFPYLLSCADSVFFLDQTLHLYYTGNESGVMASYSKKTDDVDALLQKRKNVLHVSDFLKEKIGYDKLMQNYPTFPYYQKRMIYTFIFSQPLQISCSRKLQIIKKECGFSSVKDLKRFLRQNLQNTKFDKLIKYLGITITYEIYRRFLAREK